MAPITGSPITLASVPAAADKLTALSNGPMTVILTTDPVSIEPESQGRHDCYEFFFPINSMQKIFIDDRSIDCHPGHIVPINPGQPHGFRRGNRAVSFILLQFDAEYMATLIAATVSPEEAADVDTLPGFENAAYAIGQEIQTLGARIIREFDERRPGRERLLLALTDVLAIMLVRVCYSQRAAQMQSRQSLQSERYLRFRQVIEYMQNHLSEKVSIDSLAEIAGMNRYHFIRTFKSAYAQSPYDYLTDLRIERASQLLQEASLPTSQIAGQCGFFSASRFSAAFKLATGMTPTHYRSISRSGENPAGQS